MRKELLRTVPKAITSLLVSRKIFHLKSIGESANEEDIKESARRAIGVKAEAFEVRALRPAYGGRQNATLKMFETDADNLIKVQLESGGPNAK